MIIGENQKMPAALIQLNFEFVAEWISRKGFNIDKTNHSMVASREVKERIQKEVDTCNLQFGKWEQIKKFELTPDAWSIVAGHLTPTMKMKRSVILKIYSSLVENIYN